MKTNFTRRSLLVVCTCFTLAAFTSCSTAENTLSVKEEKKERDKGKKSRSGRTNAKVVKIYPDMIKRTMHVKSNEDRQLDFFVFDNSGSIVAHHKMNEKEHIKISDLKVGTYVYQVFEGDVMTDSGKLIFK